MQLRLWPFRAVLAGLLVLAMVGLGRSAETPEPALGDLGGLKASLDWVEQAATKEARTDAAYAEVRRTLGPLRDKLRLQIETIEPRLAETDTRLKQLGDAPAADAPPEDAAVATERANLTKQRADLDGGLKQARLLLLRADQISDQINERRRAIFASELFARSPGLVDPAFWRDVASGVAVEIATLRALGQTWRDFAIDRGGVAGMAVAALLLMALAAIGGLLWRWWRRRLNEQVVGTRLGRASVAMLVLLGRIVAAPAIVVAAVQILDVTELIPSEIRGLGLALAVALALAGFGRGAAVALFAPGSPARRLIACEDNEAAMLASYLTWAARVLALTAFLNILHKTLAAPLALTVATSVLLAAATGLIALHLLLRSPVGRIGAASTVRTPVPGLRALCWLVVIVVAGALASGHAGLAAFVAGRLVVLLAIAAALAVVLTFVDVVLTEALAGDTPRGRAVAALFGISPRTLELSATMLSAVIRLLLVLIAVVPVLGPWGVFAADFFGAIKDIAFGFRVGEVTISLTAVASALASLVAGVLVARYAQRWLSTRVMPRTGLDTGLQHSIATLAGYVLLIAALALTLASLGIDLQKIALIAGALSVGIGFGLQSIVSNFVSGLILLAERPIRVGDWVVVKNEEGLVRRISVRATEIETFDRASVIIPNSEFITGVVKNWTHSNTLGRITVKVRTSYESDVEKVRNILLAAGTEHPQVLHHPPPRVFLVGFGDIGLEFELRCILLNVDNGLSVKSELHAEILKAFRDKGIAMAFPMHETRVPGLRVGD